MEIKTRAQGLSLKIETALLTQPTFVKLDFNRASLLAVAQSLSEQTGFKILLYPQNLTRWHRQQLTLHHAGALSFWQAVDELCDAASLQYNPSMQGNSPGQDQVFALSEGVNRTITPVSDSGPFRVRLLGVDYQRRVGYVPGGDFPPLPARPRPAGGQAPSGTRLARLNPFITEHFSAQLVVAAEPRLSLSPRGELRLVEAVDVRGNSLVPPARRSQSLVYASYFPARHGPVLETHALLHRPPEPGEKIQKLRGIDTGHRFFPPPQPLDRPAREERGQDVRECRHRADGAFRAHASPTCTTP